MVWELKDMNDVSSPPGGSEAGRQGVTGAGVQKASFLACRQTYSRVQFTAQRPAVGSG